MLLRELCRVCSMCEIVSDTFMGQVVEPCEPLQYSMVVWHELTSEDRRNVSGENSSVLCD